jgi:hypothetical protein
MRRVFALAFASGLIFVAPSMSRADGQAAQGYLKEAQDLIDRNIIAAKIGPFAGAKDRGVLKEDGTLGK